MTGYTGVLRLMTGYTGVHRLMTASVHVYEHNAHDCWVPHEGGKECGIIIFGENHRDSRSSVEFKEGTGTQGHLCRVHTCSVVRGIGNADNLLSSRICLVVRCNKIRDREALHPRRLRANGVHSHLTHRLFSHPLHKIGRICVRLGAYSNVCVQVNSSLCCT